jgi:sterol 3beta-glucosyltransferase
MRFTLSTFGSEGDTRPFAALARRLGQAGHEVLLFGEQSSLGIARSQGVDTEALTGDLRAILPSQLSREPLQQAGWRTLRAIRGLIETNATSWMRAVAQHASTADVVLFSGLAYYPAKAVADALRKPGVGLWLQPAAASREFSTWAFPPLRGPGWLNRLSHGLSLPRVLRMAYSRSVRKARREIFGKSVSRCEAARELTLYGFSRHLVKPPEDWPPNHQVCGHWASTVECWSPPERLSEFLHVGPKPVYVGFGAVSGFTSPDLLASIVSAAGSRRVVFYPGWARVDSALLPPNFLLIDHVPHTWLFPRVSMVMHHCGAGTTHSASQAGVPSVPLPLGGDQLHWADRLARAGVAARYIARDKLDTASLRAMIEFAERDAVRERARALGAAISQEDGVGYAVEALERHLRLLG